MNRSIVALAAAVLSLSGCEPDEGLVSPAAGEVVVLGQLSHVASAATAGPAADVQGFEVTVEGGTGTAMTDARGFFRVESEVGGGSLRLRFRRGDMDGRVDLGGVPSGGLLRVEFALAQGGISIVGVSQSRDDDFDGLAHLIVVTGESPSRVADLEVDGLGGPILVELSEEHTVFDSEGDILTFAALLTSLEAGVPVVRVEGDGARRDDGSIQAESIKAETDEDDDDADDSDDADDDSSADDSDDSADTPEFDGRAGLLEQAGDAPARTLLIDVQGAMTSTRLLVVEGETLFDNEGDVLSFGDLVAILEQGALNVEVEGDARIGDDGLWVATHVKVETLADAPGAQDFAGIASLVGVSGEEPGRTLVVTLTSPTGTATVTVAEGSTLFDDEGDILTFSDLLAALSAGSRAIRMEGDAALMDDGAWWANTLKVETDD